MRQFPSRVENLGLNGIAVVGLQTALRKVHLIRDRQRSSTEFDLNEGGVRCLAVLDQQYDFGASRQSGGCTCDFAFSKTASVSVTPGDRRHQ